MRIQSVGIKNFRSIKDVIIDFDSVTTLIGPNGTGKSTILRALDWFFNGNKGCELSDKDCSFGDVDEDIEVRVTFSNLTEKDHEALGKYAPAGTTTFTAWKVHYTDGTEVLSANSKSYPPFAIIRSKNAVTDKKEEYNKLCSTNPSLELPKWTKVENANSAMTTWEANNTDKLVEAPSELQTNFFGFNSNGKMSGLFDFVFVTADLRASEETQDAKASIINRILERSVDRTAADEDIRKIVDQSRQAQQKVYEEKFDAPLNVIKEHLNRVVSAYSPGRSICVVPAGLDLKAPKTTFNLSVLDGLTETTVDGQGHGFQRTLLISALQVLAESTAISTEGVFCLAIEEPELFQHPTQAQTFARVLRALADDPNKRVQVVYATHSPFFIEARHFDQIRRLTRSTDERPKVTVHSSTVESIKRSLEGILNPKLIDRQLDALSDGRLSAALFASRALVVEGTTDSAVFYGVGDREAPAKFEAAGLAVVPAYSKNSVPLAHALLTSLGIPSYAVFDADSGFEARAKENGKTQSSIDKEKADHVAVNRKLMKYFNLSEEDFPAQTVESTVAIFGDYLEAFLASEWPEWITSCASVEATSGISINKNPIAYRIATAQAIGFIPEMLTQIINKVNDL